ncbi:MAG: lipopolysaccharide biosynthesis protein [Bacteroidota bacterium]
MISNVYGLYLLICNGLKSGEIKMGVIKRQGIKNTIAVYIGLAIGFLNLIVIQPYFLTKEELGLTRLLYSFSLVVAMFVPLGIGNATTRFFPVFKNIDEKHHGYFGFMLLFPLIGFVLTSSVLLLLKDFIFSQYIQESPIFVSFFYYVFPLIFCVAFISVLSVYCNANYKSTIPTYINDIGVRLMTITVVSIYYLKWINLHQFILAFVGVYVIQLLMLVVYIFIFDKPGLKINWTTFKEKKFFRLISYGLLLWFASVASIGLKYFDSIVMGKYMALSFVGIYTVVAFVSTIIEAPLNAFDKIASAKIAFAWEEKNLKEINDIYYKSSLYMFIVGGFLFINVNANIRDLLSFLPDGYEQAWMVVIILSIAALYNMATGLNAAILFTSEKYKWGAGLLISLAVLAIVLQNVFIPMLGMNGAAAATALSSFFYNTMLLWYVHKHFNLMPFTNENLKVLLTVVVLGIIGFYMPSFDNKIVSILYKSILLSLTYAFIIYRLKIAMELQSMLISLFKKND